MNMYLMFTFYYSLFYQLRKADFILNLQCHSKEQQSRHTKIVGLFLP
nr:MAG TPA: hypothetical protein [Caudoviricetes sp.]